MLVNNIILILAFFTTIFSQELKVEGDLNVTGHIQNQTIDSLLQVIQDLQNQIGLLQSSGGWETRVFEFEFEFYTPRSEVELGNNYGLSG